VSLDWSPLKPNIFASGSLDTKVKIWDLMRVGFEIPKDLGGTDELLVIY
jgi:WD40 repeat protein